MHRRLRASARLRSALLVATAGVLLLATPASAAFVSDVINWNLTESLSRIGGGNGTQFHVSSGGSLIQYRWDDSPNKSTVISANSCSDGSVVGAPASYGVGDTSYHTLGNTISGYCFFVQGRTTAGSGSMSNHDGVLYR